MHEQEIVGRHAAIASQYRQGEVADEALVRSQTRLMLETAGRVRAGRLSVDEAKSGIARLFELTNEAARAVEIGRMEEWAGRDNCETLTTDTRGARSKLWFERTGKEFLTGVVENCVVCAVLHPEVGMGAAHNNTVVKKDFVDLAEKWLQNPTNLPTTFNQRVSVARLQERIELTVNGAIEEFCGIAPEGFPLSGTMVIVAGVGELLPERIPALVEHAVRVVNQNRYLKDGRGAKQVRFKSFLGQKVGVAYTTVTDEPRLYAFE